MKGKEAEIVIVGSGATGGVAALTFAEAGIKVIVVEAGPQLTIKEASGFEPLNSIKRLTEIISGNKKIQSQHPGYWKNNPMLYTNEKSNPYTTPTNRPFLWTQGKQVGGRSLTWGGITLRLSDLDFKSPEQDSLSPDWPISYSELIDHYVYLEKLFQIHGHKDNLDHLPDGIYKNELPFTESEEQFVNCVQKQNNFPIIHSRGFGPHNYSSDPTWPKSSSIGSTLHKAIETGNVEILSNLKVEKILINKSTEKATGLLCKSQINGSSITIKSKKIILCSSTIQTIRILLNSEESYDSNGFIDPSGKLGCNIMDHISSCRFFTYPAKRESNSEILSGAGSFFIPLGNKIYKGYSKNFKRGYGIWGGINRFGLHKCLKKEKDAVIGFLIGHGEVLPYIDNKVSLSNKFDNSGISIPHIDCHWRKNEYAMVDHMNKTIEEIIRMSGGTMLPITDIIHTPLVGSVLNKAIALKPEPPPPGYYIHEVGGAPMGFDEKTSVVDKFNKLWRCSNVLVVDGACWPTSAWQSPTLTMMAITRRACLEAIRPQND